MSTFNPKATPFTPLAQPTASTSTLPPPPPSTSRPARISPLPPKPLVCKFFNTDKGCVQSCRFVHEALGSVGPPNAGTNARNKPQRILDQQQRKEKGKERATSTVPPPPSSANSPPVLEKPKKELTRPVCKFWQRGYCHRSTTCLFPHPADSTDPSSKGDGSGDETSELSCSVCFEGNPEFFGLLENCSHIFCLSCIREWRDPKKKDTAQTNAKLCPLCRGKSDFITPSSKFAAEGEEKRTIIANYKSAMKQKPCRYFVESRATNPFCPYADSCFYAHLLPNSTTPFLFHSTVQSSMARHKSRRPPSSSSNDPLRNFLGAGGRSIFPFGIGGPPGGGGLAGPGGLDWFLNSMENAMLAEGGAGSNPTNSAAYLTEIFSRVLGLAEGAADNPAGGGMPPLVAINGQPLPRAGARRPRPRPTGGHDSDASSSSMPALVDSRRRPPPPSHPPYDPESASDSESDSSPPPLIPISSRNRSADNSNSARRPPTRTARDSNASDSDGGPPPLVPIRPPPRGPAPSRAARAEEESGSGSDTDSSLPRLVRMPANFVLPPRAPPPVANDSDLDSSMPGLVAVRPRAGTSNPRAARRAPRPQQGSDSDSMPGLVPIGGPSRSTTTTTPRARAPPSPPPIAQPTHSSDSDSDGPPGLVPVGGPSRRSTTPQALARAPPPRPSSANDSDSDGPPGLVPVRGPSRSTTTATPRARAPPPRPSAASESDSDGPPPLISPRRSNQPLPPAPVPQSSDDDGPPPLVDSRQRRATPSSNPPRTLNLHPNPPPPPPSPPSFLGAAVRALAGGMFGVPLANTMPDYSNVGANVDVGFGGSRRATTTNADASSSNGNNNASASASSSSANAVGGGGGGTAGAAVGGNRRERRRAARDQHQLEVERERERERARVLARPTREAEELETMMGVLGGGYGEMDELD